MQDMTDEQWKDKLTDEQYSVLRQNATEQPFSGALLNNKATGQYSCVGCDSTVFESGSKFDSGSGWPSFTTAVENSIELVDDSSLGMQRTEVKCAKCKGHLGHVFDDGPDDSDRYCINSVCLDFKEQ